MNLSIRRKLLALLSLLALVAMPIGALAATYGTPITINNPTPAIHDRFGFSVSISGDKMLIGAPFDATGATDAGSAYLYDATTGILLHTFNNPIVLGYDRHSRISGNNLLHSRPNKRGTCF